MGEGELLTPPKNSPHEFHSQFFNKPYKTISMKRFRLFIYAGVLATSVIGTYILFVATNSTDRATVKAEHRDISLGEETASHTRHPDAQWYPDAGLGLFIHWGIASVKGMNISW